MDLLALQPYLNAVLLETLLITSGALSARKVVALTRKAIDS